METFLGMYIGGSAVTFIILLIKAIVIRFRIGRHWAARPYLKVTLGAVLWPGTLWIVIVDWLWEWLHVPSEITSLGILLVIFVSC